MKRYCLLCEKPLHILASPQQQYCTEQHRWRMNYLRRSGMNDDEIRELQKKERKGYCQFCKKEVESDKKFCSYDHWNLHRYYKEKGLSKEEIFKVAKDIEGRKKCLLCDKSLENKNRKAKFCDKKHYRFYTYHKSKGLTDKAIKKLFLAKKA